MNRFPISPRMIILLVSVSVAGWFPLSTPINAQSTPSIGVSIPSSHTIDVGKIRMPNVPAAPKAQQLALPFQSVADYSSCYTPYGLDSADLNGDNILDVVIGCRDINAIQVMLGTAAGALQPLASIPTGGTSPRDLKLADFNGDARIDVVVANISSNLVSLHLGTGTGSFNAPTNFSTGSGPNGLAVGDVNKDGRVDVAVSNYNGATVSVLLGNGNGTLNAPLAFPVGTNPSGVAIGDLNIDGWPDIAVPNQGSNTVSILFGTGSVSLFGTAVAYPTDIQPNAVVIHDLNLDGQLDMAITNGGAAGQSPGDQIGDCVSVFLGTGAGVFGGAASYPVLDHPVAIAAGDLYNNGVPDLVVTNWYSNDASVLIGTGDGAFQPAQSLPTGGAQLNSGILVDINRDGNLDFVLNSFHYALTSVRVFLGIQVPTTSSSIAPAATAPSSCNATPTSTATATATPTSTATATPTSTATPSATKTNTATPTSTATPSATPTVTPTSTSESVQPSIYLPWIYAENLRLLATVNANSIPIRPATVQGEIYYTTSITLAGPLPAGGHFYFSSSTTAPQAVFVDDQLIVSIDGVPHVTAQLTKPAIVEIARSDVEQWVGRSIQIQFQDTSAAVVGSSPVWLIWTP